MSRYIDCPECDTTQKIGEQGAEAVVAKVCYSCMHEFEVNQYRNVVV